MEVGISLKGKGEGREGEKTNNTVFLLVPRSSSRAQTKIAPHGCMKHEMALSFKVCNHVFILATDYSILVLNCTFSSVFKHTRHRLSARQHCVH